MLRKTVPWFAFLLVLSLAACGGPRTMMMKMMGMGDMASALHNMDYVMKDLKTGAERRQHMMAKQSKAIETGKKLFNDAKLGTATKGVSCNSCHPGGDTTGGTAQVPMRQYQMPIPSLIGASATFPKYKPPNDAVISLQQMNNNCNKMFMGGKGLQLGSEEARYLAAYVALLSNGQEVSVGQSRMKMMK
jgi:thiosulfate dehydrogenase